MSELMDAMEKEFPCAACVREAGGFPKILGGARGIGYKCALRDMALSCLLLGCILSGGCGREPADQAALDQTLGTQEAEGEIGGKESGRESGGKEAGPDQSQGLFSELRSKTEELFSADEGTELICMQFYQGEPVELRCRWNEDEEGAGLAADVYLYKEDGSSEFLFEDMGDPNRLVRGTGCLAQDGSFYHIKRKTLKKWDSDGRLVYEKELDMRLIDICQLTDETIVVLAEDDSDRFVRTMLMKLDEDKGTLSGINNVMLGEGGLSGVYKGIAASGEGLLLMERTGGIYEIDLKSGSMTNVLSFRNSTIELSSQYYDSDRSMHDFRILENGDAQILWGQKGAGVCETLYMGETEKTVLVIRGYSLSDQWLKERISEFNRTNEVYQIILDSAAEEVEWEDYARQTSVELAAGKGPDILYGEVLGDYMRGVLMQGGFADLRPYIEESGFKTEDYFPTAFCSYGTGDGIYGISTEINAEGWVIRGEVLGGEETPDIRTLVEALAAWQEEAGIGSSCDEEEILRFFLEGSESLWGMIYWEQGRCDFGNDLFTKILEVSKRYAYEDGIQRPSAVWRSSLSSFDYYCAFEAHKQMGCVAAGTLFDDGCYAKKRWKDGSLAVNVNSPHKQGAWEFIAFLLGDRVQETLAYKGRTPVSRTAFDKALELRLQEIERRETVSIGTYLGYNGQILKNDDWVTYKAEDVTEEWIERYRQTMEEVRDLPLETEPILEIVCQEAADYFNGTKTPQQVAEAAENRVQLYLDENPWGMR